MAFLREDKTVLYTAASFQDVWVFGVIVAFADDVCGAEFEFFGERGGAGPLYGVFVVVRAAVLAAHYLGFVEAACGTADAFQLSYVSRLYGRVGGDA